MPLRWGPGPVFVHESIAATRRWQLYAFRSFFVFSLLGALAFIWLFVCLEEGAPVGSISIQDLAAGGQYFFYAIATTQLMVVLLAAPAATAGAICLDRARGSLTHMLVTDLADSEIVLGKLAARFLPVAALVAATIPVLAISGLLGGLIFEAILMTTPLSTDRIVLAKWWGAYRVVPALAFLPAMSSLIIALGIPDRFPSLRGPQPLLPAPLDAVDRIAYVCIPVAMLLAQGAVVTSAGLALATWIRRVGRAVAVNVTVWAGLAFGWIIVAEVGVPVLEGMGLVTATSRAAAAYVIEILATACPAGGQVLTFTTASWQPADSRVAFYIAQLMVFLATVGLALVVLALTMVTFDRCVGRVSERPRRAPRPPRRAGSLSLRLPESLHKQVRELAAREGISINQFVATAVAEKMSALLTEEYLEGRAQRGSREGFERAMAKVKNHAPDPSDQI